MKLQNVTRTEFAELAEVSKAAVTKACKNALKAACDGMRINKAHPDAVAYLEARPKQRPKKTTSKKKPHVRGSAAKRRSKKINDIDHEEGSYEIPTNLQDIANLTIREAIQTFGTDTRLVDYLRSLKAIEDITAVRLKNAATEGKLITRDIVSVGIISPMDELNRRLLKDGVHTMVTRLMAKHDAGAERPELEELMRNYMSRQIVATKTRIDRTLAKL